MHKWIIIIVLLTGCNVVRPNHNKYFVLDSIRVAADTSGMKIENGDTIRYSKSRVVVKERKPLRFKNADITKWEAMTLVLLLATLIVLIRK